MKQVIECKRACIVDTKHDKVLYIFAEEYRKEIPTNAILCLLYNPNLMEWDRAGNLWFKDQDIKIEVYNQYTDAEEWFDKFFRWLGSLI